MKNLFLLFILSPIISITIFGATLETKPSTNSLIIYNGNVALVHEKRNLDVDKSDHTIIYEGVANTIETDSVNVKLDQSITLYSQQFRFDKLTQKKLLDAHIDKEVQVRTLKDSQDFEIINATLLSSSGTLSIVKTDTDRILTVKSNDIIFKTIPNELITKPSLVWNISAKKSIKTDMEIDYLIKSIDWRSNYILNIHQDSADLSGWISINNRSGKKFEDTQLFVLAGNINRVKKPQNRYREMKANVMYSATPQVQHQAYEGYHFYSIPFKVNLKNNEKTQIKFIDEKNLKIKRKYSAFLSNPLYIQGEQKRSVSQFIEIDGLDFSMPKGVVRSYSKLRGMSLLLGESNINHTPKKTPIELKLGDNFDLSITQTVLKRDDIKKYLSSTIKYTLKNSSDNIRIIEIKIPFNKNSTSSVESSQPYKYTKGNIVSFTLSVNSQSKKEFIVKFRAQNR